MKTVFMTFLGTVCTLGVLGFPAFKWCIDRHKLEYVRETTVELGQSFQEQARGVKRAVSILPDYSRGDLVSSLSSFVEKTIRLKGAFIREVDDEVGHSGDRVFRVFHRSGDLAAIVKVFKERSGNFLPEIFSLHYLLQIPRLHCPKILSLGKCQIEKEQQFLLCESGALGQSFYTHYKAGIPFEELARAMRECGCSLAKIHQFAPGPLSRCPEEYERRIRGYLVLAVEKLRQFPRKGIDPEQVKAFFERTLMDMNKREYPTSVVHGDTKLVNVFYDRNTRRVTWIDPQKLADSLDQKKRPIGIPAKDLYSFLANIEAQQTLFFFNEEKQIISRKLASDEQVQQLKEAFLQGYQEAGGILPSKEQLDFFSLAAYFYYIQSDRTCEPDCPLPPLFKQQRMHAMSAIYQDLQKSLLSGEGLGTF